MKAKLDNGIILATKIDQTNYWPNSDRKRQVKL